MGNILEVGFRSIRIHPTDKKKQVLEVLRLTDTPKVGQRINGKFDILDVQNHPDPEVSDVLLLTTTSDAQIAQMFIPIVG